MKHLAAEVGRASNPRTASPAATFWLRCRSPRSELQGGTELKGFQGRCVRRAKAPELRAGGVGARGRGSLSGTWCLKAACRKGRHAGSWPSGALCLSAPVLSLCWTGKVVGLGYGPFRHWQIIHWGRVSAPFSWLHPRTAGSGGAERGASTERNISADAGRGGGTGVTAYACIATYEQGHLSCFEML